MGHVVMLLSFKQRIQDRIVGFKVAIAPQYIKKEEINFNNLQTL